jgi:hypothetical protein
MAGRPSAAERLADLFQPTPRGVVGLVDDLLAACRGLSLRLDYADDHCHIRVLDGGAPEPLAAPLPKSVFRAVLARVAALCNERVPASVTPYRGAGELADPADSHAVFRVAFTNTPDEQRLELTHAGQPANGSGKLGSV